MHIKPFDVISYYNKTNLLGIYMFRVDNKCTITKYKTSLKLKLENKYTRKTLSDGGLLSILLNLNIFLTCF